MIGTIKGISGNHIWIETRTTVMLPIDTEVDIESCAKQYPTYTDDRMWLFYIAICVLGAKKNSYLSLAMVNSANYKDFAKSLFRSILTVDRTDEDFQKLYEERKEILRFYTKYLSEIMDFCKVVSTKQEDAVYYLTDLTKPEKEKVIEWLDTYGHNYSADQLSLILKNVYPDLSDYLFSKEVSGGAIYFDSLSETAARVSKTLFIPRSELSFDIEATDSAIATYLDTGYMLIRDIDSFLVFPNVGYEWNEFLLETYLMYFSRKYALFNNGRSLNNVAGAVVRRGSGYEEFADVCADILAKSGCSLTKNKALEYLGEVNLLTRRSYRKIDSVLVKAKQIRNRKE